MNEINHPINFDKTSPGTITYISSDTDDIIAEEDTSIVEKLETLRTILGTMVMMPKFESDPGAIGKQVHAGTLQQPIVMGTNRDLIESKLIDLVKKL